MNERFEQLDSLRGLAALSVVFNHFLNVLPGITESQKDFWFLKYTPIHLFWAGHEAVIFFFVLSGFVLSLQFFKKKVEYRGYLIKRVCRIYIPYLAAVVVAIAMSLSFYDGHKEGLSIWFNRVWTEKPTLGLIVQHLLLIPSFRNNAFNPVLWSLVHEMRLSIIFPLIAWVVIKYDWKKCIGIAFLVTLLSVGIMYIFHRKLNWHSDYPLTIHYIAMFIFGALLARYRGNLINWYQSLSRNTKYGLLGIGIICYLFSWLLKGVTGSSIAFVEDWVISIGVSIFIISAIGSVFLTQLLVLRPVLLLGRTSYSVYLFHAIILLSLTHLLYGYISLWAICLLGLACTFLVSWLSYQYVEIPSITIGRQLAGRQ